MKCGVVCGLPAAILFVFPQSGQYMVVKGVMSRVQEMRKEEEKETETTDKPHCHQRNATLASPIRR